jgi:acyl-CoA hydrolase
VEGRKSYEHVPSFLDLPVTPGCKPEREDSRFICSACGSKIFSGIWAIGLKGEETSVQPKRVKDSMITIVYQMTHQDANLAGNVHGGVILKNIDNTAGIVAGRHANTNVVTASIDRVDFYSPVFVGDLLRLMSSINYAGKTSVEVGVRVEAENFMTGQVRHTASAYLTLVALDSDGKPTQVPPIIQETEDEKRRNTEAKIRKDSRLKRFGR